MTMAFGAEQLRKSDDPKDQEVAKLLEAALALRGKDIPLPGHETESTANETKTELGKIAVEHSADETLAVALEPETLSPTARFATTEEAPVVGLSMEAPTNMGELVAEVQILPEVHAVIEAARAKAIYHPDEKEKSTKLIGGDKYKYIKWEVAKKEGKKDIKYKNKLVFDDETKEPRTLEVVAEGPYLREVTTTAHYTDQSLSAVDTSFEGKDHVVAIFGAELRKIQAHGVTLTVDKPFLRRVDFRPQDNYDYYLQFNLEVGNLGVTIRNWNHVDVYTYNPDKDIFEGTRNDKATLPAENAEDFKTLISRVLSIIPIETKAV